jgi:phospholipase C
VSFTAPYVVSDPDHGTEATKEQIFGCKTCFSNPPPMNGFVQNMEGRYKGEGHQAINMFNYTEVPIISTLAREFAVFDQWFADVPGK